MAILELLFWQVIFFHKLIREKGKEKRNEMLAC